MSTWKEVKCDDIELSDDETEIVVLLGNDDNGNNYITIKLKDIFRLLS